MAAFKYPGRDIDRPETLIGFLGTHWNNAYDGREQVKGLMGSRGRLEYQKQIGLQEAIDNVSRFEQPLFHRDHWFLLKLRETQRNAGDIAILKYGDADFNAVYDTDPVTGVLYKYGTPNNTQSIFPLAAEVVNVPYILSSFDDPTASLTLGLDYFLSSNDDAIVFRNNPFDDTRFLIEDIYDEGIVVDREITLWCFRSQHRQDLVYRQFGYVVGLALNSSAEYRDYVNAIWDAAVDGTAVKQVDQAVAAMTDTPIVVNDTEVVEHVTRDERHTLIITDTHVYRYPLNAVPIVSVGDTVRLADQLVDTVQIFEFHDGTVPDITELRGLELSGGFLIDGFEGGISWTNDSVAVSVDTSGMFTRVEWPLGGFVGDVAEFWDQVHARGVENPPTLAQLLDTRTNQVGEPGASNLPATINPLEFLIQNVLRNNAYVVRVNITRQGDKALPFDVSRKLRSVIPPHTAMLLVVELAVDEETITLDAPGDTVSFGMSESLASGDALEPIEETLDLTTMFEECPVLHYTGGLCI